MKKEKNLIMQNITKIYFAPKIIAFTNNISRFIERNAGYYNLDIFYKYGGITTIFEGLKILLTSIAKNQDMMMERIKKLENKSPQIEKVNEESSKPIQTEEKQIKEKQIKEESNNSSKEDGNNIFDTTGIVKQKAIQKLLDPILDALVFPASEVINVATELSI